MSLWELSVNFFIALFALIDPVGNVPIFAAATSGATPAQRRRVALYIAAFITVFLTFFYFTGLAILEFFGISMSAFRIAGGVLLFLLGLDMTREDFLASMGAVDPEAKAGEALDVRSYARQRFERLIVPFAMPLLIGPGAISTVIIQAGEAKELGVYGTGAGFGAIVAVGIATLISFWLTGPITKALGRIGMVIVIRVLGLILCAMAVQFIFIGLFDATDGLITAQAARPYAH